MKGLLIKDLYMMKKYLRIFFFMIVFFAASSLISEESNIFLLYCMIFLSIFGTSLTSYDERFHWDRYCDTMPISRCLIVAERYLLNLAMVLLMLPVICLIHIFQPAPLFGSLMLTLTVSLITGLVCPGILYPVVFALGTEKGRIAYYVIIFGAMLLAGALTAFASENVIHMAVPSVSLTLLLCLLSLAVYTVSWLLAVFFYKKRTL